jgi:acyl-CoA reductase-like NAD-dependent aldehyde dehydrogenase
MKAMAQCNAQSLCELQISGAEELAEELVSAKRCRRDVIASYSTDRIVAALVNAASEWLDPEEPLRLLAIDEVARATDFHRDMVATGIDFIFSAVTANGLERLARAEGEQAPRAVFHSLAGNVPGQGVPAIARALLARSIVILRDSERQPVITAAFRETLRRHDPVLAAMVLPVTWSHRSGDRGLERVVIEVAERVELYGSDPTVGSLAARYQAAGVARCELHGARVSAGLVLPRADVAQAARAFAVDVVMYEGRGCLTPHAILVEGDCARASEFAEALAIELAAFEARWPRARGSVEEETARRRFIDDAEMQTVAAADAEDRAEQCLLGPKGAWCIRRTSDSAVTLGPGMRCVRVARVADHTRGIAALRAVKPPLAGVGVAGATRHDGTTGVDDTALDSALRGAGATLVCPAGRMQAPPIDWRPQGRPSYGTQRRGSP